MARRLSAPRLGRLDRTVFFVVPAMAVILVLFVFPLVKLIGDSVSTANGIGLGRYTELLGDSLFKTVVWRTVRISGIVTIVTCVLGYSVAYFASRLRGKWPLVILACVALPLFTSTLVRSYAWRVILANNGLVNSLLLHLGVIDKPLTLLYNDTSIIIGMSQVLMPLATLPLFANLRSLSRDLVRAAESASASPVTAWRTVTLPLSMPGLIAGASLVFISSLGFYTTPALLGGLQAPMFAQLIDSQVNYQASYGPTTAQSTVVLIAVLVLVLLLRKPLGLGAEGSTGKGGRRRRWKLSSLSGPYDLAERGLIRVEAVVSPIRWILGGLLAGLSLVFVLAPQVVVFMLAFNDANFLSFPPHGYSFRWFESYFSSAVWQDSTWLSLRVSVFAALLATLVGSLAAFGIVRTKNRKVATGAYVASLLPMVLPAILYAVGLFFVYIKIDLIGTQVGLVLCYLVIGLPYVVLTVHVGVRGIDPLLERAAASMGANGYARALHIILPLLMPAIISGFLLCFIQVFDDLVLALFLGSAKTVTLQMRMYENIQVEISPQVAAVGTVLTVTMLVLGSVPMLLRRAGVNREGRQR